MKANKFFAVALAALTLGFVACQPKEEPQADKLALNQTEITVAVDATAQLTANMEVTWSSSNEAIATVDAGLVKGIAAGEAVITAKSKDNQTATCKVTVTGGTTPPDPQKIPEIDVTDGSLADWDALPAEFVVSAVCPENASLLGLKSVKVYATAMYINILVEYDPEQITDREWPAFHVYINTDNSDATGGYSDEFLDPNADVLLETAVFDKGEPNNYNPAVFKWWGEVGGSGWDWSDPNGANDETDYWGAIIGEGQLPVGNSEYVDGKFEIQLLRELLGTVHPMSEEEFGIGFDIQQNWSSVGILPIGEDTEENPGGYMPKLKVKINK